jgi:hypothetical protein
VPTGRAALPGAERSDVSDHVRLGGGTSAPVDRAVALSRLERRRVPLRLVAGGHDVVVPVQQYRRGSFGPRDLAGEDRGRVGQIERREVLHTDLTEERADLLVRLEQRRPRRFGKAGAETDGTETSRASSDFSAGMSDATVGVIDGSLLGSA